MWTSATRHLSINGSVMVGGLSPMPLRGVLVDIHPFSRDGDEIEFASINHGAATTSVAGDFAFTDVPVSVQVQTVIPGSPPYTPVEITNPASLPSVAFRIGIETDVGASGSQFVVIYDEREVVDGGWISAHPERIRVPLTGSPAIPVLVPEGYAEAALVSGLPMAGPAVPGKEIHLLRIGRVIRQELGELGDTRPEYVGKAGYMRSSNTWTVTPPEPSFFPGIVDAPYGRTLHVGGHFGANFMTPPLSDNLYYTLSVSGYAGNPANPFDPANLANQQVVAAPLFNKKYLLPTATLPKGKWETLNLGPFNGSITAVEPPHDPALVGTSIRVYKRPPLPDPTTEYWPFWDLLAIWPSTDAADGLAILTIEAYERTGGTDTAPELNKLAVTGSINDHLPLQIDNRRPVPRLFDWRTAFANFGPPELVGGTALFDPCGEMPVTPGQVNANECILVRYSVEDGAGGAHPHLLDYSLWVEYTPRQVTGAPLSATVLLRGQGNNPANPPFGLGLGYADINGGYATSLPAAPVYEVQNYESVLVPRDDDSWPPEPMGDPPAPCVQYAAEVGLRCRVRTINGWGRLFGHHHASRHIIIKR